MKTWSFEELALGEPAVRQAVTDFLKPYETQALFLLGNLKRYDQVAQRLFLARAAAAWQALLGYYPSAHSLIPFALPTAPDALPALVAWVLPRYCPAFEWYLGTPTFARPGLDILLAAGRRVVNDPTQVFMERTGLPPVQPFQDQVRWMQPADAEPVIHLLRWLRAGADDDRPISAAERAELIFNPDRVVLERDGQIVATAATNGLAFAVYQVLGVATAPPHRGKGYAGAVVAGLMQRMAARGGQKTVLFTRHDNTPAIRCYQKLGFQITGDYLLAKLAPPAAAPPPAAPA